MNSLARASIFSGLPSLIKGNGGNERAILSRFKVPLDIEQRPESFIPFRTVVALLEFCSETLKCPDFGLRLSAQQGLPIFGPLSVLARNAETVESALRTISWYLHVQFPAVSIQIKPHESGHYLRLQITINEPSPIMQRQVMELAMGNGHIIMRMLAGNKASPLRVFFPHPRLAPTTVYKRFFNCDVVFNQSFCAVDLPMNIMQTPIASADPQTAHMATEYLMACYGDASLDLPTQVSQLIQQLLPSGHANIKVISEQLCLHPRTLQRRLADNKLVFEQLIDDTRMSLAQRYLSELKLPLSQVAGLLGYADQSTLNRACRRWFDTSPLKFRKKILCTKALRD